MGVKKLTFKFTEAEAGLLLGGLGKLTYESSFELINNLTNQHEKQMAKPDKKLSDK